MKKIILSLFIAMIAFLSSTCITASKPVALNYFYAKTIDNNYAKIYGLYTSLSCLNFDQSEFCGYNIVPIFYPDTYPGTVSDNPDSLPDTLYNYQVLLMVNLGYLTLYSSKKGIYIPD